jgi:hypothetical protein
VQTVLSDLAELKQQVGDLGGKLPADDQVTAPPVKNSPTPAPPPPVPEEYDFSSAEPDRQSGAQPTIQSEARPTNVAAPAQDPVAELSLSHSEAVGGTFRAPNESQAGSPRAGDTDVARHRSDTAAAVNAGVERSLVDDERAAERRALMAEIARMQSFHNTEQAPGAVEVLAAFREFHRTLIHALTTITHDIRLQQQIIEQLAWRLDSFQSRMRTRPE